MLLLYANIEPPAAERPLMEDTEGRTSLRNRKLCYLATAVKPVTLEPRYFAIILLGIEVWWLAVIPSLMLRTQLQNHLIDVAVSRELP